MNDEERSQVLKALGLTPTVQRLAVLSYLEENSGHPTAEEAYRAVQKRFSSISKATVYNALEALENAHAIRKLSIDRGAARYDANPLPHPHFLCRVCGNLYDVALPCPIRPGDVVLGNHIEEVHTYLYGVCAGCRNDDLEDENDSNSRAQDGCGVTRRTDA
jgi:Fur family transcriptional regulator, peroxide stress response regulator